MNAQELFEDLDRHLCRDDDPSAFLLSLSDNTLWLNSYPFTLLSRLKDIDQSPKYHPEGNVWNHTVLVTDNAARCKQKSSDPRAFIWAALLHDTGKAETTKMRKGRLTAYDHDKAGARLAGDFLRVFSTDEPFIDRVVHLTRWHMQALYFAKSSAYSQADQMLREVTVRDIAMLSLCDRFGRGGLTPEKIREENAGVRAFVRNLRQRERALRSE